MWSSSQLQLSFLLVVALSCSRAAAQSRVPQDEVDALARVVEAMGNVYWRFNSSDCRVESFGVTPDPPADAETNVTCDCNFPGNVCHVTSVVFKRHSLPGILPPELVNLPYIHTVDLAYNYLNGTIPKEWASLPLQFIGVLANRLSGEIPAELGNITTLTYLDLEANQLSGAIPRALGKLTNLQTLMLSSNLLTGSLPVELGALQNLTNFRINDNMFSGQIPDYIQNWKNLTRLEMIASGLRGPIPPSISALERLADLRISDISADTPARGFPPLNNMTGLTRILLRNCNLTGEIPSYIWNFGRLRVVDLSFNRLIGTLPTTITTTTLVFLFLSNNLLEGDIPQAMLKAGTNVDLSYNNLKWQSPRQPVCQNNLGLNLNLYRSFSGEPSLKGIIPCVENFKCPRKNIKGTNVLLDRNLNPKISNFGLAKLHEEEKTHISTRVAGTIGYMAPEYALWGYLSYNADVYSFGIVALEIVSGKHNMDYQPEYDCTCLLDWACQLQRTGKPTLLVDEKLGSNFDKVEVERMIRVALLCTNASPSLRANMSEVVGMLEGAAEIPDVVPESSGYGEDLRFKALRDCHDPEK